MDEITLAILGAAHVHFRSFAPLLNSHSGVRVKWVVDSNAARAEKAALVLNAQAGDLTQVVADSSVDGFVILSENFRHLEYARRVIKTKKPFFIEKPLAMNGKEAEEILQRIREYPSPLQTGFKNRFHPMLRKATTIAKEGTLGKVRDVFIQKSVPGDEKGWLDPEHDWMRDKNQAGVGLFGDIGTHALDLFAHHFGKVKRVRCELYPNAKEEKWGIAELNTHAGIVGTIRAGWDSAALDRKIIINGSSGSLMGWSGFYFKQFENKRDVLAVQSSTKYPGEGFILEKDFPSPQPEPLIQWIEVLQGARAASELISIEEAVHVRHVLDAVYLSAQKQDWVEVASS